MQWRQRIAGVAADDEGPALAGADTDQPVGGQLLASIRSGLEEASLDAMPVERLCGTAHVATVALMARNQEPSQSYR